MNKSIMRAMGFEKEVSEVEEGICPLCHRHVGGSVGMSEDQAKEWAISGLCIPCQDDVFGAEGADDFSFNDEDDSFGAISDKDIFLKHIGLNEDRHDR